MIKPTPLLLVCCFLLGATALSFPTQKAANYQAGNRGPDESSRLNQTFDASEDSTDQRAIAQVVQVIDAAPYRGKQIRVRSAAKIASDEGKAHLWLFAADPDNTSLSTEDFLNQPITSRSWNVHTRTQTVDENADRIAFGGFLQGAGEAWFDDFTLLVRDDGEQDWTEVTISNGSFEEGSVGEVPGGWVGNSPPNDRFSIDVATVADAAHEGEQAVRVGLSISEK